MVSERFLFSSPEVARSFWSAPTSGKVQHQKSMIHRLPVTLRMLIIVNLTNLIAWENELNSLHMLRKLDPSKRHNSWCWPKWVLPLGTRMKGSLNRPWTKMKYLSEWNQWRINYLYMCIHVMFQVSRIVYWSLYECTYIAYSMWCFLRNVEQF